MSLGRRNPRIDLLRGVSILLVLFHHFNIAYRLDDTSLSRLFGWDAVRAVARNGNYGVTIFFVISGYLITSNADRRWGGLSNVNAGAFYGLRAARILPCLLLLLGIVNMLAAAGVPIFQNRGLDGSPVPLWLVNLAALTFWMNVLIGTHGWFNYPLGVLWSLSVEEVFYLSFPLIVLALGRRSRLLIFWGAVVLAGPAYRFTHQGDEAGFLYAYLASFDGIAIGCCTALLAGRVALRGAAAASLQGVAAAAMTTLYLWAPIGQTNVLGVTAMALGAAALLIGAQREPGVGRNGVVVGLGWVGRLSYELYLFHLLVLAGLRTLYPPAAAAGDEKILLLGVYLVLSATLSAAIARFFAEPLNGAIRRRTGLAARVAVRRLSLD